MNVNFVYWISLHPKKAILPTLHLALALRPGRVMVLMCPSVCMFVFLHVCLSPYIFTNFALWAELIQQSNTLCVCLFVCVSVPFSCDFFQGLLLVLRSHDQIPASHWSTLLPYHFPLPIRFFCMVGLVQSVPRPWTGVISISISSRALKTRRCSRVRS